MNSTSKFNVGDKVRILDVEAIDCGATYWINGDVLEVVTITENDLPRLSRYASDTHGLLVLEREFHAIERVSPLSKKRRIEALEKDVARQETELEELRAKIEAFEQKAKSAVWLSDTMRKATKETSDTISKALLEVTPNQRRARIIADAKGFVEQTIEDSKRPYEESFYIRVPHTSGGGAWGSREIKYEINAEKRAVVALAIGYTYGKVVKRAVAKCAPDDVFNADIGKAIAVGRLFGLDVERFINAPKPDKKVVGHVVQIAHALDADHVYGVGKITDVTFSSSRYYYDATTFKSDTYRPDFSSPIGTPLGSKIIDDTEAQYE